MWGIMKNWFNKLISKLNCLLKGHTNVISIEEYEVVAYRAKNFKGIDLEKLKLTYPYIETSIYGKLRCNTCGQTYIGITVKDNVAQWKP